jgi:hypothetical protein
LIPRGFGRKIALSDILLDSQDKISDELDILKFYEDSIKIGDVMFDDDIDKKYESLYSEIDILDPDSSIYKDIVHCVTSTESHHHYVHLHVKNIFTCKQKKAPKFDSSCGAM